jgi:TolB-like protein
MKKLSILIMTLYLAGCSTVTEVSFNQDKEIKHGAEKIKDEASDAVKFQKRYRQKFGSLQTVNKERIAHSNALENTVTRMMQDLVSNLQYVNGSSPIAVTSFIYLDEMEGADVFGNYLAESFIHEVHKFGIPVIDFKAMDFIRVTPQGDFVMSRDFLDLESNPSIRYVLTGTLVELESDIAINARIIGLNSKAVVATAQARVSKEVADSLASSKSLRLKFSSN